jgi:hypothetical protein
VGERTTNGHRKGKSKKQNKKTPPINKKGKQLSFTSYSNKKENFRGND